MGNVDETLMNPPKDETFDDLTESDRMFAEIDTWCAEQLSGTHKTFLQSFDSTFELKRPNGTRLFCYHGSPRSHSEEVTAITSEERLDELFDTVDTDVLAGGHTHFPFTRRYKDAVLLNPGSVGLPYVWDRDIDGYRNPAGAGPPRRRHRLLGSIDAL